jgi:glutamine synthetase
MCEDGGIKVILDVVKKLGKKHKEHIQVYGEGNDERLTGLHETASIEDFSYGVGNRGASIRIPTQTDAQGKGYMEDRRPASNIYPYVVTEKLEHTTCILDGSE